MGESVSMELAEYAFTKDMRHSSRHPAVSRRDQLALTDGDDQDSFSAIAPVETGAFAGSVALFASKEDQWFQYNVDCGAPGTYVMEWLFSVEGRNHKSQELLMFLNGTKAGTSTLKGDLDDPDFHVDGEETLTVHVFTMTDSFYIISAWGCSFIIDLPIYYTQEVKFTSVRLELSH